MRNSQLAPTVHHLRERAAYYRRRAKTESDKAKSAAWLEIAQVLEHEAEALAGARNETPPRLAEVG